VIAAAALEPFRARPMKKIRNVQLVEHVQEACSASTVSTSNSSSSSSIYISCIEAVRTFSHKHHSSMSEKHTITTSFTHFTRISVRTCIKILHSSVHTQARCCCVIVCSVCSTLAAVKTNDTNTLTHTVNAARETRCSYCFLALLFIEYCIL
jgi:hypothetical protein